MRFWLSSTHLGEWLFVGLSDKTGRALGSSDAVRIDGVLPVDPNAIQEGPSWARRRCRAPTDRFPRSRCTCSRNPRGHRRRPSGLGPSPQFDDDERHGEKITAGSNDRTMKLRYRDGEKTIVVPNGVRIVTMKPGDRSLLVSRAKVIVTEQVVNGQAVPLLVGRNGFEPPM